MSYRLTFPNKVGIIKWYSMPSANTLLGACDASGTIEIPENVICRMWIHRTQERLTPIQSLEFLRHFPPLPIDKLDLVQDDLDISPLRALTRLRHLRIVSTLSSQSTLHTLDWSALTELEGLELISYPRQELDLRFLTTLPNLKKLRLYSVEFSEDQLHFIGQLENLRSLEIQDTNITPANLKPLSNLQKLEELAVSGSHFEEDVFECFLPFQELRSLNCTGGTFTDGAISNILSQCPISHIKLSSKEGELKARGFDVISRTPLESVVLYNVNLDDVGMKALCQHQALEQINLEVASKYTSPTSIAPLKRLPSLSSLHLCNIMASEPNVFAQMPSLQSLRLSQTYRPNITYRGQKPFVQQISLAQPSLPDRICEEIGELPHLRRLSLSNTHLSDVGFASMKNLSQLETLALFERGLNSQEMAPLKDCTNLNSLSLGVPRISKRAVRTIAGLPKLTYLLTSCTRLRIDYAEALCELQNLRTLNTDSYLIRRNRLDQVRACLPSCYVNHTCL